MLLETSFINVINLFLTPLAFKMAHDPIVMSAIVLITMKVLKRRMKRKHKFWVREWLRKRSKYGAFHQLLKELQLLDTSCYQNFLRMDSSSFEELLQRVGPKITF